MECTFDYKGKCRLTSSGLETCDKTSCPFHQSFRLLYAIASLEHGSVAVDQFLATKEVNQDE